jgi:hypothetical protein
MVNYTFQETINVLSQVAINGKSDGLGSRF